jgi:hypothetical protein
MKIGKANEKNVTKMLPRFIGKHSPYRILHIEEYGLLSNRERPNLCVSPDGIMVVQFEPGYGALTLLEIKTKVSKVEVQKEMDIRNEFGHIAIINSASTGNQLKQLIPDRKHRVQMLHGMAVTTCEYGFYVVASSHEIIRVVCMDLNFKILGVYREALHYLWKKGNFGWIEMGDVPNSFREEDFRIGKLKYAVDKYTVEQTIDIYHCVKNKVIERGIPLPNGQMLIPSIVGFWNKCKGPINVYSRYLRDSHGKHKKQSANGRVWIRSIMTCVYNAYRSYILYRTQKHLNSSRCQSYSDFQRAQNEMAGTFDEFISDLSDDLLAYDDFENNTDTKEEDETCQSVDQSGIEQQSRGHSVQHNRRNLFVGDGPLVQLRLNPKHKQKQLPKGQQHTCVVCCRNNHTDPTHKIFCKKRHGFRPTYICQICDVPLCVVPCYNGESCFWWFHNSLELPECCTPEADQNIMVCRRDGKNTQFGETDQLGSNDSNLTDNSSESGGKQISEANCDKQMIKGKKRGKEGIHNLRSDSDDENTNGGDGDNDRRAHRGRQQRNSSAGAKISRQGKKRRKEGIHNLRSDSDDENTNGGDGDNDRRAHRGRQQRNSSAGAKISRQGKKRGKKSTHILSSDGDDENTNGSDRSNDHRTDRGRQQSNSSAGAKISRQGKKRGRKSTHILSSEGDDENTNGSDSSNDHRTDCGRRQSNSSAGAKISRQGKKRRRKATDNLSSDSDDENTNGGDGDKDMGDGGKSRKKKTHGVKASYKLSSDSDIDNVKVEEQLKRKRNKIDI